MITISASVGTICLVNIKTADGYLKFLVGLAILALTDVILLSILDQIYREAAKHAINTRQAFLDTFGSKPDDDHYAVQRAVNGVLEELRRSMQGAFGRMIGAQRKYVANPCETTVAAMNERKKEAEGLKKTYWDAVGIADDWRYDTPMCTDEPIPQLPPLNTEMI